MFQVFYKQNHHLQTIQRQYFKPIEDNATTRNTIKINSGIIQLQMTDSYQYHNETRYSNYIFRNGGNKLITSQRFTICAAGLRQIAITMTMTIKLKQTRIPCHELLFLQYLSHD